jgi:hypothetical protein
LLTAEFVAGETIERLGFEAVTVIVALNPNVWDASVKRLWSLL